MKDDKEVASSSASVSKKGGSSAAIIAICAVLALGGVGFGIFEMIQANSKKEPTVSNSAEKKDENSTEKEEKTDCTTEASEITKGINVDQNIKLFHYVTSVTKNGGRYELRLSQHGNLTQGYFELAMIGESQAYELSGYAKYADGKLTLSKIYDNDTKSVMDDMASALGFTWTADEGSYKKVEATFSTDSITLGSTKFEGINK